MKRPLVISCLFTKGPFDIYPAPDTNQFDCVFFSNDDVIGQHAEKKGWTHCKIYFPPGVTDNISLSLYSKYIKYLQFLREPVLFNWRFSEYSSILYFDHKHRVFGSHIEKISKLSAERKILLRKTPTPKNSIWQEVKESKLQHRYAKNMELTKSYIEMFVNLGYSTEVEIQKTSLIFYNDVSWATQLTNRVYNSCILLQQPECQIFWALHAQDFQQGIEVLPWDHPAFADLLWQNPAYENRTLYNRVKRKLMQLCPYPVPLVTLPEEDHTQVR